MDATLFLENNLRDNIKYENGKLISAVPLKLLPEIADTAENNDEYYLTTKHYVDTKVEDVKEHSNDIASALSSAVSRVKNLEDFRDAFNVTVKTGVSNKPDITTGIANIGSIVVKKDPDDIATTYNFTVNVKDYAPLNNPTFTGTPRSTHPSFDDYGTRIATTKFVQDIKTTITGTLDEEDLNSLRAVSISLNKDPTFAVTMNTALDSKLDKSKLSVSVPKATSTDYTSLSVRKAGTITLNGTAYNFNVKISDLAPLDSPTFTGIPVAPNSSNSSTSRIVTVDDLETQVQSVVNSTAGSLSDIQSSLSSVEEQTNFNSLSIADLYSNKQPLDADLTSIASLTSKPASNKYRILYSTAANTYNNTDISKAGLSLLQQNDITAIDTFLSVPRVDRTTNTIVIDGNPSLSWAGLTAGTAVYATTAGTAEKDSEGHTISSYFVSQTNFNSSVSSMTNTFTNQISTINNNLSTINNSLSTINTSITTINTSMSSITNGTIVVEKAEKDSEGNTISDYYATKEELAAGLSSLLSGSAKAKQAEHADSATKDSAGNTISAYYLSKANGISQISVVRNATAGISIAKISATNGNNESVLDTTLFITNVAQLDTTATQVFTTTPQIKISETNYNIATSKDISDINSNISTLTTTVNGKQASHTLLTKISNLNSVAANKVIYTTAKDTFSTADITAAGLNLIKTSTVPKDKILYTTAQNTFGTADITIAGLSLLKLTTAAEMLSYITGNDSSTGSQVGGGGDNTVVNITVTNSVSATNDSQGNVISDYYLSKDNGISSVTVTRSATAGISIAKISATNGKGASVLDTTLFINNVAQLSTTADQVFTKAPKITISGTNYDIATQKDITAINTSISNLTTTVNGKQASHTLLTKISNLNTVAKDKIIYTTAKDTFGTADITPAGLNLLSQTSPAAMLFYITNGSDNTGSSGTGDTTSNVVNITVNQALSAATADTATSAVSSDYAAYDDVEGKKTTGKTKIVDKYLTNANATLTFLTKTDAASTYLSQSNAASTYLTQTAAANDYLTKTDASNTYLTQTNATNNYLTKAGASSTYVTKTEANNTYISYTDITGGGSSTGLGDIVTYNVSDVGSCQTFYGLCNTAANTGAKQVQITNNTNNMPLAKGARLFVKFTNGNTANSITLQISDLDGDISTTAQQVFVAINSELLTCNSNSSNLTQYVDPDFFIRNKNLYVEFIYTGSSWLLNNTLQYRSYIATKDDKSQVIADTYVKDVAFNQASSSLVFTKGNGTATTTVELPNSIVDFSTSGNILNYDRFNGTTGSVTLAQPQSFIGICNTAAATQVKSVCIKDITDLSPGTVLLVKFINGNTYTGAVKLTITDEGGNTLTDPYDENICYQKNIKTDVSGSTVNLGSVATNSWLKLTWNNTRFDAEDVTETTAKSIGAINALNDSDGNQINTTYAKIGNTALTGTPTAPTPDTDSNSTQIATTAWVRTLMANATVTVADLAAFTGATSSTAGSKGVVPAPAKGDQDKYLKGNGTWETIDLSGYATTASLNNYAKKSDLGTLEISTGTTTISGLSTMSDVVNTVSTIKSQVSYYGTCTTAAVTSQKTVSDITDFVLQKGSRITIKFTNTNTATNSLTLKVGSTAAKPIYYAGNPIPVSAIRANRTYDLVYDGTNYDIIGSLVWTN